MAKTNKTLYAILGMLSIAPMSGYEIRQIIQQSTSAFWSESDGQLYPTLTKLNKLGLVSCKIDKADPRKKKIYHLTTKGMQNLSQWLEQEPDKQIVRNEFLLKIFFGANIAPTISLEHVQIQHYQAKAALAQLTETKQKLLSHKEKKSPHLPYWLMSIHYGMQMAEAKLNWCNDVTTELKKL